MNKINGILLKNEIILGLNSYWPKNEDLNILISFIICNGKREGEEG